jgi:succinoglycan biosynthesis transport protein ExoP
MDSARVKLDALRAFRQDPNKLKSAMEILDSKLIQDLTVQKAIEQAKVAGLLATYSSNAPELTRLRAGVEGIQAQTDREIDKLLNAVERQYTTAADLVDRLNRRVTELKAQIAQEDIRRVLLQQLQRRANADSDLYGAYLRQSREAIEAVSWHPVAANIVADAVPPVEAMFPHNRLSLPLGIFGSALTAMVMGALFELKRQQRVFSSPMDIREVTGIRVLGSVPKAGSSPEVLPSGDYRTAIENLAFRVFGPTETTLGSFFTTTSAARDFGDTTGSVKPLAVAVTSAVASEGKSVLVISLAKQFLLEGARVIIIDADIRQPSILALLRKDPGGPISTIDCSADGTIKWQDSENARLHVFELASVRANGLAALTALPRFVGVL